MHPDSGGGGGGGGIVHPGGYGHCSHSHIEDAAAVMETRHFYKGHEITVVERLRFIEDNKVILYAHEVKAPNGATHLNEWTFDAG